MRLPELGTDGQTRIQKTEFEVAGGADAFVEILYLHRAGAERVTWVFRDQPRSFPHAPVFHFDVAREFAASSWRALGQLRNAIRRQE